ncbi:hypothetical protein ACJJIL_06620 [Microbulbifer sp. EKSA005]|uniref:hypothetical protein n=1 Tax=Microbulbifer sp. EKSA005 TaxID=3243364 RepID=UPI0040410923
MAKEFYPSRIYNPEKLPKNLLITLDKAMQASKYSGWAWTFSDEERFLCSGAGMVGYPIIDMWKKLLSYPEATSINLSGSTYNEFITLSELLSKLKHTSIQELNLPFMNYPWWAFKDNQRVDSYIDVDINYYDIGDISNDLYFGPFTLKTKKRPWITCFTTDTSSELIHEVSAYEHDFGYIHKVEQRVLGSHALIHDKEFNRPIYKWKYNAAGSEILTHQYKNVESLLKFFSNLVDLNLSTAVLIVNNSTCLKLMELDLIDELFITNQFLTNSSNRTSETTKHLLNKYSGWSIKDSHVFSLGVQVELLKTPF